jgi:hypothetical protein
MKGFRSKELVMLTRLRSYRPGHGTVVAYLALFVALGGTSYGVATGSIDGREIKNNSVGTKDLRNNAVRGRDVRTGTLRSSDVANRSLLRRDFAPGQLPAGPQGPPGPAGRDGFDQVTRNSLGHTLPSGASDRLVVHCDRGTAPTGGSAIAFTATDAPKDVTNQVVNGQTFDGGTTRVPLLGWAANATNSTGEDVRVFVDVACATADNVNFP